MVTVSLPLTNRAPAFNFKVVLCNLSNPPQQGEKRGRGRFERLKSPTGHSRQAPLPSVSHLTSPHPTQATKVSLSGWFINCQTWIYHSHPAQKVMQNRNFPRISCPSPARPKHCRKRLFENHLSALGTSVQVPWQKAADSELCRWNLSYSVLQTSCFKYSGQTFAASLSGILKDLFSLSLEDLYESSGKSLPSKKHQQIFQLLLVLMWQLHKPKCLERNLL